jgi:hypothetical protein
MNSIERLKGKIINNDNSGTDGVGVGETEILLIVIVCGLLQPLVSPLKT